MAGRFARTLPYALLGALAAYLYYAATQIDFYHREGVLGPDFWPKLVLALILVTCAFQVLKHLFFASREVAGVFDELVEAPDAAGAEGAPPEAAAPHRPFLLIAGVGLTTLYVWIIQTVGFFVATVPYLFAFIAIGGYRRWAVNAAVSAVGTLVLMFFFMKVVYVSLPLGRGPFSQVTFFLMQVMGVR